jgi:signal transduction histidine kinase
MPILDRRYILPVALVWAFLIGFFVVTEMRRSEVRLAAAQIWVATDRIRMLTDIRSLITDAETGQRGFLLTGDESYLEPFARARNDLPGALDELRSSYPIGNDPAIARFSKLDDLMDSKLGELTATIDLYKARGPTSAMKVVNTDVGARTMDELRTLIDEMRTTERARVARANELWNREHVISSVVMAVGTVLNMLLVLLAGHLVTRDVRRRRELTKQLETEVAERTRELDELSSHLQQITEAEKGALARELHDELGAVLVAVKMDLSQLRLHLPKDNPEIEKRWERIQSSLSEGIDLKRRVVEQLRPTLLDNMGLAAALKWQLQEACGRAGLACREHFTETEPPLRGDASIAIFRVVQESLTNILKHAHAQSVDLSLAFDEERLIVTVEDDGIGIPPARQNPAGLHGLKSMRHRVRSLGGQLVIGPGPNQRGTRVLIAIPLARIVESAGASA